MPLQIITPDRVLLEREVSMVTVKGGYGELGILPRHTPLATTVKPCLVKIKLENGEAKIPVTGGFLEVLPNAVTILADAAELPHEIDPDRAEASKQRALAKLASNLETEEERKHVEAALLRAELRLEALDWAQKHGNLLQTEN
ncbi:ATP synthase F1 subunit epsilon [Alicyclobacillus tolerans]|uniref:ATP synthase F1 subunit epsilon n=1 Tax=Alicyclobacillus TaxID=29330 RepID=UPI001EE4A460|nr:MULTISPECIES: ATP synthase F1 subunit epsilon [Alicyclobacillus]